MINPQRLRVNHKVWLEIDGKIFGEGLFELLALIHQTGSISAAARQMNMSYRAAWGKIKTAEKHWHLKLVETHVGGNSGGGAVLTATALNLLDCYQKFTAQAAEAIDRIFKEVFYDERH